jgi:hypothetical protein
MTSHDPSSEDEAWELPELPAFDERYLRRAIRRGILRTAAVGALYVVLASILVSIGVQLVLAGLGRQDQLSRLVTAWHVAHPEFVTQQGGVGPSWLGRYQTLDARLLTARPDPAAVRIRLSQNLWGHIADPTPVPQTAATAALYAIGASEPADIKQQELRALGRLPAGTAVAAVVEFAQPLDQTALDQWLAGLPVRGRVSTGNSYLMTAAEYPPEMSVAVYGWSPFRDSEHGDRPVVASFRHWVAELHDSDAGNLRKVGIDLDRLREAARAGLVHGVIVAGLSPAELSTLLSNSMVRAAHTYDVSFASIG